jgi:hypothetical protein
MSVLTKEQLKTLSDDTFFDNDNGEIEPSEHREFNNAIIDALVCGATLNGEDVPVNEDGKLEMTFSGASAFTFVVDSNEALAAWANNTEGNDYSHVLIKAGTWTSDKEVNLTTAGTKVVVGQAGNLLSFTSAYGLKYDGVPSSAAYWMEGVNVNVTATSGNGFYNCTNLTNCSGTGIGTSSNGFSNCTNLTNCTGNGRDGNLTAGGVGFYYCTNLANCTGSGSTTGSGGSSYGVGFANCTSLANCTGTASGTGTCFGFYNCTSLTNCTGTASAYGFYSCTSLANCAGSGTGSGTGAATSYGFYSCRIMLMCKPVATSGTTATYGSCYMHASGTTDPVADTAAGGWNRS